MINSASRLGSRSRHLRIALGAPITVLVTVGPLEIFLAENGGFRRTPLSFSRREGQPEGLPG
jgi:hypothetical protein